LIWCEIFYDPGGACGTYREEEKCLRVLKGKSEERAYLKYRGVGGRMILKYIIKQIVFEGVDWIDLARDADKRWRLLNTVMDF
jgi:hypothetical protein